MVAILTIAAAMIAALPASKEANPENLINAKVTHLVVDSDDVELAINENAPKKVFRKGPCLIIRGLFLTNDKLPAGDIIDFTLQRQEFKHKPKDFKEAKWETVDIITAKDVLDYSVAFSADQTPKENRCAVITMPVPKRKDGEWDKRVLHPRLVNRQVEKQQKTQLFRYIDFGVKPGVWYRYRVRLAIREPGNRSTTNTHWSDPSALKAP